MTDKELVEVLTTAADKIEKGESFDKEKFADLADEAIRLNIELHDLLLEAQVMLRNTLS